MKTFLTFKEFIENSKKQFDPASNKKPFKPKPDNESVAQVGFMLF